jgi:hypothetical protein
MWTGPGRSCTRHAAICAASNQWRVLPHFFHRDPPRTSQECALAHGMVPVASERATEGRSRSAEPSSPIPGSTSSGVRSDLMCRAQGREREQRDHERSWDVNVAEAVAFLVSAQAILKNLSNEPFCDPGAAGSIASVCEKVSLALSTLDEFIVTEWIKTGATTAIGYSFAPLPTWWECLTDLA